MKRKILCFVLFLMIFPLVISAKTYSALDATVNLDETKFDVSFGEVNVDDDFADEITSSLGIRNIPVTIFFKDGKEIKRLVGLKTVQDLYNEINDAYS